MKNTGLLRRVGSMLYDILLILALMIIVTYAFIAAQNGESVEPDDNFIYQITLILVVYFFFIGFWVKSGRTLGMQSWRLQLVDENGQRPNLTAATVRFFSSLLSWLPFGLGFLWQLWDKNQLTWHDRISKTKIIYYPKGKN
ncbi:MAG: hypothetical protein CMQ54_04330 [Gammaproteobacteria bacterium]|nr:hypothetical protein [Gammaproteobacteria bacterium]|tara:strand:- start:550 stop:972 length:423 start_codon:yes stop_codon:yes gene_type:complete